MVNETDSVSDGEFQCYFDPKFFKIMISLQNSSCRAGVVVRVFTFHQCGLGSIPRLGERFFSGQSLFSKTNISFDWR